MLVLVLVLALLFDDIAGVVITCVTGLMAPRRTFDPDELVCACCCGGGGLEDGGAMSFSVVVVAAAAADDGGGGGICVGGAIR